MELIWALRRNAEHLTQFEPELLASLPSTSLIKGCSAGVWLEEYLKRQEDIRRREQELRDAKKEKAGEGESKCPKCGCKMDMRMLQTRGADEPMTVFKNCVNCTYVVRF